jgi:hypothetical protein
MKLRVKDRKLIQIVNAMLKAGIMEDGLYRDSEMGTPQGGVISPLLANIYLDRFDQWWFDKWGKLTANQKAYRRKKGRGHFKLIRYADDWLMLSNATKKHVVTVKDEIREFLWDELKLRLSESKTKITHVKDGFDFLGWFFVWTRNDLTGKDFLLIRPSKKGIKKFRMKIKQNTHRRTANHDFRLKLQALNRIIRGWGNYHRYINSAEVFSLQDWYVNQRIGIWLKAKTGKGIEYCLKRYRFWRSGKLIWGCRGYGSLKPVVLFDLNKLGVKSDSRQMPKLYRSIPKENPYINGFVTRTLNQDPYVRLGNLWDDRWSGQDYSYEENWRSKKRRTILHDHSRCVECGATTSKLEVHHRMKNESGRAKRTLCQKCHLDRHRTVRQETSN